MYSSQLSDLVEACGVCVCIGSVFAVCCRQVWNSSPWRGSMSSPDWQTTLSPLVLSFPSLSGSPCRYSERLPPGAALPSHHQHSVWGGPGRHVKETPQERPQQARAGTAALRTDSQSAELPPWSGKGQSFEEAHRLTFFKSSSILIYPWVQTQRKVQFKL